MTFYPTPQCGCCIILLLCALFFVYPFIKRPPTIIIRPLSVIPRGSLYNPGTTVIPHVHNYTNNCPNQVEVRTNEIPLYH